MMTQPQNGKASSAVFLISTFITEFGIKIRLLWYRHNDRVI